MCEWCGHEHPKDALCTKRPRWSRRGFLSCVGLGLVGMALPALPKPLRTLDDVWDHVLKASPEEWKAFRFIVEYDWRTDLYLASKFVEGNEGLVNTTVWSKEQTEDWPHVQEALESALNDGPLKEGDYVFKGGPPGLSVQVRKAKWTDPTTMPD